MKTKFTGSKVKGKSVDSKKRQIGCIKFEGEDPVQLENFVEKYYTKLGALNGLGTMHVASRPTVWLITYARNSVCGDGSGTVSRFYKRIFRKSGVIVSYAHFLLLNQNIEPMPGINVAIKLF